MGVRHSMLTDARVTLYYASRDYFKDQHLLDEITESMPQIRDQNKPDLCLGMRHR